MGRRGTILLETLLAIALFAVAAVFTIAALRNALAGAVRAERRAVAADRARSAIAALEVGLVTDSELARDGDRPDPNGLLVELRSTPSAFPGLVLVEVTVRDAADDEAVLYELRQLVRPASVVGAGPVR